MVLPVATSGKDPIGKCKPWRACSAAMLGTEASNAVCFAFPICMKRIALVGALLPSLSDPCAAQFFFQWADDAFPGRRYERPPRPPEPHSRKREQARKKPAPTAAIADGGLRPDIK